MHTRKLAAGVAAWLWAAFPCFAAGAPGGNALDRIDFGSAASEAAHQFDTGFSSLPVAGVGALGLPYREAVGTGANDLHSSQALTFTMAVNPTRQNYLTVKLWGSDVDGGQMSLLNAPDLPAIDQDGGPPAFPGRFFYETVPIPLAMSEGKTTASLTLNFIAYYDGYGGTGTHDLAAGQKTRPVYSAFTHTAPRFDPPPTDPTGVKPPLTGQATLATLSVAQADTILQANRERIYGPGGDYDQVLSRQIPAGTPGAPPEVIGLDLWANVADWMHQHPNATPDAWRDQVGGGQHGPGYADLPDELISGLIATYQLPLLRDVPGQVVPGLDHYHDPAIIRRLVSAFDGCTYLQAGDGRFNRDPDSVWNGLTSTPRSAGHAYAGSTARAPGWTLSLEGVDSEALGDAILKLLDDPTGSPLFRAFLRQSYNADLTGVPVLRATAYERMLHNDIDYLRVATGGTESQNQFQMLGLYASQVALEKLQRFFPNSDYPALPVMQGLNYVQQATGLAPDTLAGVNPAMYGSPGLTNFGMTRAGLGEAHGVLSSGYDGRYGDILPWLTPRFAQLAALDPGVQTHAARLIVSQIEAMARASLDSFDHFLSPLEKATVNAQGQILSDEFTFGQEDFITYRNTYNPNANGNGFYVCSNYVASDPSGPVHDAYALRSAYLQTQYHIAASPGDGGGGPYLQYLRDLPAYENTIHALVGLHPDQMTPLPGEAGQPDFAWMDVQNGAVAFMHHGERFYMNADWRNFEISGNHFGKVSNYARIHDTQDTIDRAAMIVMPHDAATAQSDGNLSGALEQGWVVRYGRYLIAGNNSTAPMPLHLPAQTGSAVNLMSGRLSRLGTTVMLRPGQGAIFALPSAFGLHLALEMPGVLCQCQVSYAYARSPSGLASFFCPPFSFGATLSRRSAP